VIDLDSFKEKPVLPISLLNEHLTKITKSWDLLTTSYWHTDVLPDLNSIITANYFKLIFTSYFGTPPSGLSRRSVHIGTNFHPLQNMLYQIMNTEVLSGVYKAVGSSSTKSAKPRITSPSISGYITRSTTPQEKLFIFVELIKRLRDNHKYVFDVSTTDRILSEFNKKDLIVTGVQTLLVPNGSEIPDCSAGHLKPGASES